MVGDSTYIDTRKGWLYLATVIGCHTKAVIGWATDDNYKTPLIEAVLEMAAGTTTSPTAQSFIPIGAVITSAQFAATLKNNNLRQSVGRTGSRYDNTMAESFFGTLTNERTHRTEYPTREQAVRKTSDTSSATRRTRPPGS
jgi:transposase InsO family protein